MFIKYTENITFHEARNIIQQHKQNHQELTSKRSYANIVTPVHDKQICQSLFN